MSDQVQPDFGGVAPDKQIVKASNEWLHPLQPYGAKKALREMTRRIMEMDTGKIPMIAREAAHLAQQAASAWLNPFTGEIWGWVQLRGDQRIFTIMPGRRGLLRHAHEQAREINTHFWPEYRQITDPDERANLFIPEGALAYECQVKDHLSQMTWNETLEKVTAAVLAGIEIDTSVIQKPPFVYGLGILTKQEMANLDKTRGNKMTHVERTQKRSYMMGIKQMFDLPLGGAVGAAGETIDDYVMDVEWREVPQIPSEMQCLNEECGEGVPIGEDVCPECGTEGQLEHLKEKAKEASETLYEDGSGSDEPTEIPEKDRGSAGFWPNSVLNEIVARMGATNVHNAAKILAKSEFKANVGTEPACAYVKAYRSQKDQDKSSAQCHKYALEHWQELMKKGG